MSATTIIVSEIHFSRGFRYRKQENGKPARIGAISEVSAVNDYFGIEYATVIKKIHSLSANSGLR
jgi:hypothetical protein